MKINGNPDGGGGSGVITSLSITSNGTYTAGQGVDGYSPVDVDVQPELQDKNITQNGEYTADQGYDGLGTVNVNVQPSLQNKTVNVNGSYTADEGYYGLSTVTVSVPVNGYTITDVLEGNAYTANIYDFASFVASNAMQGKAVETVSLPNCKYIYNAAFQQCTSLSQISLPECSIIKDGAFMNAGIRQLYLPKIQSLTYMNVFANCSSLSSVNLPNCSNIGQSVFSGCKILTDVSLPICSSVDSAAFFNCSGLVSIELPQLLGMPFQGFRNCTSLTTVSIPACAYMANSTFQACSKLNNLTIGLYTTIVPNWNSRALQGTPIASNSGVIYVNSENYSRFTTAYGWSSLSAIMVSVELSEPLLSVSDGTMYGCVVYQDGNWISYTGADKASIQVISLPNLAWFSTPNLYGCTALTEVNLPTVKYLQVNPTIGISGLFESCTSLQTLNMPNLKITSGSMCKNCTSLSNVNIPMCQLLNVSTFAGCTSLSQISLPECTKIYSYAFDYCSSLTYISLPKCSYLDGYVFRGCTSLSSIYLGYSGVCSQKDGTTFVNAYIQSNRGSIFVPASLVDAYKSARHWSEYSTQIFPIPE